MISVVVPVYNTRKDFLIRARESLKAQTFQDFEVVYIDDGSDAETASFLDTLVSPNERVIHQENQGIFKARERGYQEAKGDYLFFLDSDDALTPKALEKMMKTAQKEDSELVIASFNLQKEGKKPTPYFFRGRSESLSSLQFARKFFVGIKIRGFVWGRLYKKELLDRIFPFPYPNRIFEDAYLAFVSGIKAKNVVYLNFPCLSYTVGRGESLTGKPNPRRLEDHLYAYSRIKEECVALEDPSFLKAFHRRLWIIRENLAYDKKLSIKAGLPKKEAKRLFKEELSSLKK
ncbi:MAG: glycosyltransferase family 2 protein [Candidatus Enteromonas sp.]